MTEMPIRTRRASLPPPRGRIVIAVTAAWFTLGLLLPRLAAAQEYSITNIGVSSRAGSFCPGGEAVAVNDAGVVAARSWTCAFPEGDYGFIHDGASLCELQPFGEGQSSVADINDAGQVIGVACDDCDFLLSTEARPFLWDDGQVTDLAALLSLSAREEFSPTGINATGQIVGALERWHDRLHTEGGDLIVPSDGLLFTLGSEEPEITILGSLGGRWTYPADVNNHGQVVGSGEDSAKRTRAFLYFDNTMQDLGTLGGGESGAVAINDRGQVVGWSRTANATRHAFLWEKGVMTDLGTLGEGESFAVGINNAGDVVGESGGRAVLWRDGHLLALDDLLPAESAWRLWRAVDINDCGQMVGTGFVCITEFAFLLTPISSDSKLAYPGDIDPNCGEYLDWYDAVPPNSARSDSLHSRLCGALGVGTLSAVLLLSVCRALAPALLGGRLTRKANHRCRT